MQPPRPGKGKQKSKATDEGGRGEYKTYTSANMVHHAISVVVNGTHSFRAAVQCFRVPKTSLQRNVATAWKARSMTSFSNLVIFTQGEEAQMVAAIIRHGKAALPWTVKALRRKLLAHAMSISALPDVKSVAVKCTYQQFTHHQRETERLHQELIVQNLPAHPRICEVLALAQDNYKCSKRYKVHGRRHIMGEDAQMLWGERAMRGMYTKWLKKTDGHALRRWRAMAKETARHKLAQERARDKEHHARRRARKAATRAQEKARANMEKQRAAAAAIANKAARQAERKRAEAAAKRVAAAAKAVAKDKALMEKEDEKLRQAAQKEARATDAITK
eukprot:jgi/Tetstr1/458325/TSEL_004290.t1